MVNPYIYRGNQSTCSVQIVKTTHPRYITACLWHWNVNNIAVLHVMRQNFLALSNSLESSFIQASITPDTPLTQAVQEFTPFENYYDVSSYTTTLIFFFYWILLFYSFIYYMQFKHYYISRYVIFFTWFLVDLIINIVHFRSVNYLVYRARVIKKGEQHPNFWIKGLH